MRLNSRSIILCTDICACQAILHWEGWFLSCLFPRERREKLELKFFVFLFLVDFERLVRIYEGKSYLRKVEAM